MSLHTHKTVIVVTGPTASGKTAVAIRLAKHFKTEIISADSRQCYKELNIGVARPLPEELNQAVHHFIASVSVHEEITAAFFEQYALQKASALFKQHNVIIMVGGTGLYIKAFCEGLDHIPAIDPSIREEIKKKYEIKGIEWLQNEMRVKDPAFYKSGEINNPQRMMRALEVKEGTGKSILTFRKGVKATRNFDILKIGLDLPKEELHSNINNRVDIMIEAGLLDEVKDLTVLQNLNALQTVGYSELFDYLKGTYSLNEAIEKIKINTRQYAKRQLTWFRKDDAIKWISSGDTHNIISLLQDQLKHINDRL